MFVGEAPGEQEDKRGEPFVGPAGELLDKMIEAMGWSRADASTSTTSSMCRPPGNRNPQPDEVAACKPFLEARIGAIAPRIIVALGRPAANTLLGTDAPISSLRGKFHDRNGIKVMPTFHPAYLLREPDRKRDAWADLKLVMAELARLGIQPPPRVTPRAAERWASRAVRRCCRPSWRSICSRASSRPSCPRTCARSRARTPTAARRRRRRCSRGCASTLQTARNACVHDAARRSRPRAAAPRRAARDRGRSGGRRGARRAAELGRPRARSPRRAMPSRARGSAAARSSSLHRLHGVPAQRADARRARAADRGLARRATSRSITRAIVDAWQAIAARVGVSGHVRIDRSATRAAARVRRRAEASR